VQLTNLSRIRMSLNLSQSDLARMARMPESELRRLEAGSDANPTSMAKLAAALNRQPYELVAAIPDPTPDPTDVQPGA
jgi:transcriptional regulator with XRE-family HTH domain